MQQTYTKYFQKLGKMLTMVLFVFLTTFCKSDDVGKKAATTTAQSNQSTAIIPPKAQEIDALTAENVVISYIKAHKKLPPYYITKKQAKDLGWTPSKGNLCDVAPLKAIGGDVFGNREKKLPTGEKYFEADLNYQCGRRGKDRVVFNKKGDIYLTKDHYETFQKQ